MELLLAIVIFGLMGAFTVFGYLRSEQSARERARSGSSRDSTLAGTSHPE